MEHESDGYTIYNCRGWYRHQRVDEDVGRHGNKSTSGACPNYSIIEIGQNNNKRFEKT